MSTSCLQNIENYWKLKTTKGNKLFNKGNYKEALDNYKEALYRAEVLNNNVRKCSIAGIPFIQVYMISCNNLANTHKELGELSKANKLLKRSVYYLLHLLNNNKRSLEDIHNELKKAVIHYFNFIKLTEQKEEDQLMLMLKSNIMDTENFLYRDNCFN